MLRSTVATAALVGALAFSSAASAQTSFGFSITTGPSGGYYRHGGYGATRFYDQRYYGDWRDHRGHWHGRPHFHYHAYPFPHYDLHYGGHRRGHWHGDHYHHYRPRYGY